MGAVLPWLRRNPPKIWLITVVSLLNLSSLGEQIQNHFISYQAQYRHKSASNKSNKYIYIFLTPLNITCLGRTSTK